MSDSPAARPLSNASTAVPSAREVSLVDLRMPTQLLFREHRIARWISQSRLARMSGASRFRSCRYEFGDGPLNSEERCRLREALGLGCMLDRRFLGTDTL